MASVAICTAVSKPKVRAVPARSLSVVLGTPTLLAPIWCSLVATPRLQVARVEVAAGDHLHGPQEEVLLAVRLAAARLPGGTLEPLARDHLSVVSQAGEQIGIGARQVPADQRAQEGAELRAGQP